MNDHNAPAVRRRIDEAQIDEWRNECLAAARHGADERTLEKWLLENGCPPRTRLAILAQARGERGLRHRPVGAKALGLGLLLCAAGLALIGISLIGVPAGSGMRAHSAKMVTIGAVVLAGGLTPLLLGLWKRVTSSAVSADVPRR
jgi:hypothetical protein